MLFRRSSLLRGVLSRLASPTPVRDGRSPHCLLHSTHSLPGTPQRAVPLSPAAVVGDGMSLVYQGSLPDGITLIPAFLTEAQEVAMFSELAPPSWLGKKAEAFRLTRPDHHPARSAQEEERLRPTAAPLLGAADNHVRRQMRNLRKDQLLQLPATTSMIERVVALGHLSQFPDGSQVNVYPANGEIPFHVDAPSIGNVICMASFFSNSPLDFVPEHCLTDDAEAFSLEDVIARGGCRLLIPPRSLLILTGTARHEFAHRVPAEDPFHIYFPRYSDASVSQAAMKGGRPGSKQAEEHSPGTDACEAKLAFKRCERMSFVFWVSPERGHVGSHPSTSSSASARERGIRLGSNRKARRPRPQWD